MQRDRYRSDATMIDPDTRRALAPHFSPATLDAARVRRVASVDNPDFFAELDRMPMDLRDAAGITYGDTILISALHVPAVAPPSLVFHELVHVVQYSILGIPEFARRYVAGWVEHDFEYLRIPLEVQAYALEKRFVEGNLEDRRVEEWLVSEPW